MNILRLYGAGSATANGVATVIMPSKATIRLVQWAVDFDMPTDNMSAVLEVSRASATEVATNGSQQAISEVRVFNTLVTSGLQTIGINTWFPVAVPVIQGQIIYLHAVIGASGVYRATVLLHWA